MPDPIHLRVRPGDVAELVVTSGDPARTEQLARMLSESKLVNTNRGLVTYSGYYGKRRVTVSPHGMGGPSASIVFEKLWMMGAKVIVRLGTAGGLVDELRVGDCDSHGRSLREGVAELVRAGWGASRLPDLDLQRRLVERCTSEGVVFKSGLVFSSDAFYGEDRATLEDWVKRGAVGVEMECATLFTLGRLRGFRSAGLLIISNSKVRREDGGPATAEILSPYVEKAGRIVLDSMVRVHELSTILFRCQFGREGDAGGNF